MNYIVSIDNVVINSDNFSSNKKSRIPETNDICERFNYVKRSNINKKCKRK